MTRKLWQVICDGCRVIIRVADEFDKVATKHWCPDCYKAMNKEWMEEKNNEKAHD